MSIPTASSAAGAAAPASAAPAAGPAAFAALAEPLRATGGIVPVWRDILLDTDTAVSAYARLRRPPFSFLLESAPAGEETWSRYTFLGTAPRAAWRLDDRAVREWTPEGGWGEPREVAQPLDDLRARLTARPVAEVEGLPAFWSGAVGFFSYDVARLVERLPAPPPRGVPAPDALFVFPRAVVVLDNLKGLARVVCGAELPPGADDRALAEAERAARAEIDATVAALRGGAPLAPLDLPTDAPPATGRSSIEREAFLAAVARIREYIAAGDCFQALLARRISVPHDFEGLDLYRALRALNPSPYMFHLALDGVELVGSSPELLVRVADRRVTVRPIAGTRPRGATPAADDAMAQELLADEKERAEHVMLVDLGRNDVGRVAEYGSVAVTELMQVERYSHVLHIVSQVEGRLRDGASALDAFAATFPAGTMTGAPKIRAMEIIDELEPERRGAYAGAVGWIGSGDARMDLAITIRTCVIAGGEASVQAGAGIVADSVPALEWQETENKARALLTAIGRVRARGAADA